MGPFRRRRKGNKYLFVVIDYYSKFTTIKALKNVTTDNIIKEVEKYILRYGTPLTCVGKDLFILKEEFIE